MKKLLLVFSLVLFSAGVLIFFVFLNFNDGKLHLVFCNVGQGDAIFIRTPKGADILVDGGPDKSVLNCLNNHMPFWDRDIEAIILTHPDADHSTGVVNVIERYHVRALFTQPNPGKTDIYKLFEKDLAEKKISAKYIEAGDVLKFSDDVELDVVSPTSNQPDPNLKKTTSLNMYSVITRLRYGKFTALLTGDASADVQDRAGALAGDVDVLKVPHHGSKYGMEDVYLDEIKPEIAVISVGAHNRYGHPAQLSLDLLKKHHAKIYRTDQNGEVDILSDGLRYSIQASINQ